RRGKNEVKSTILIALLAACCTLRQDPPCVSVCGMLPEKGGCGDLKDFEASTLLAVDRYADDIEARDLCQAVKGWKIEIHKFTEEDEDRCARGAWWEPIERHCVVGIAHPVWPPHTIELAHFHWKESALFHEMIHVVDIHRGKLTGPWHCGGELLGRKDALYDATGYPDTTREEKACP